ncbi:MAG: hypothetical protein DHS20C15_15390 [Planctomycetota bacterium]|nr:MAG: hypothetical protein DHS20C15_15390 [Planctomycetota bacterium]
MANLLEMLKGGGPLMIPIALCSVVALAYIVERSIRLRMNRLARKSFGDDLVKVLREGGVTPALERCATEKTFQARILAAGLKRADATWEERDKAVEDTGSREVDRLSAGLRPLVVIGMIAPLLGLLGTVWGMIAAFQVIATGEGLGDVDKLAGGISQALVTTAAGLVVAIPAQAAYYYYRSRIDRFVRRTEDAYAEVSEALRS